MHWAFQIVGRLFISIALLLGGWTHATATEVIRLATTNYLPHYGETMEHGGPAVEIIKRALEEVGHEVEITYMPFARALYEAQKGDYAGVAGVWFVESRLEHFYYSQPMYANHLVLFAREESEVQFQNYRDLENKGWVYGEVIGYDQPRGIQALELAKHRVSSDEKLFELLIRGRVDIVSADLANGLHQLNTYFPLRSHEIEWLQPAIETRPLYVMFSKKHALGRQYQQDFDEGLRILMQRGEVNEILTRHLGAISYHLVL